MEANKFFGNLHELPKGSSPNLCGRRNRFGTNHYETIWASFRVGSVWDVSLGSFGLRSFVYELSLGILQNLPLALSL